MNTYIIGIIDLENIIIKLTHYKSYNSLVRINKTYKKLMEDNILFQEYKQFMCKYKLNGPYTEYEVMLQLGLINLFENIFENNQFPMYICVQKYHGSNEFCSRYYDIDTIFKRVCTDGYLITAGKMYIFGKINLNMVKSTLNLVYNKRGSDEYLKLMKLLFSLGLTDIYNHEFISLCENGLFVTVKQLYSMCEINLHYNDDAAFINALKLVNLQIVKWLYSLDKSFDKLRDKCEKKLWSMGTSLHDEKYLEIISLLGWNNY